MYKINWARVFAGGLLAGFIINVGEFLLNEPVLGNEMAAAMERLNLEVPGPGAIMLFVFMGITLGILAVWLYAAIRPRFGPGPRTAVCAGLVVWALSYLYPSIGFLIMGFFPAKRIGIAIVWELVELVLATVAGAWLYKETEAT